MNGKGFDAQGFARGVHELLVLASLRQEPKHGYQIALDVESESGGVFRFKHGTLYPILHRLEEDGLVRGSWSASEGRRRKVYALTRAGRTHLSGETRHVERFAHELLALLRGPGEVEV